MSLVFCSYYRTILNSHTINPTLCAAQGRIKELMDALPPDERQKALELLLAAKESQ